MTNNFKYEDNGEKFLLDLFSQYNEKQSQNKISQLLLNNLPWEIFYHLTPKRKALLNWFDFQKNKSLLEIGAGCGALTGLFLEKGLIVTAQELEKQRGEIIKRRFKGENNLTVKTGNFAEFSSTKKFDYITLIGVLEYAGRFYNPSINFNNKTNKPFIDLVSFAKSFLKKNGTLFIAIENKLGLKYLTGFPEDHYGLLYEGIHSYPHYNGISTFSKNEIENILIKAGLKNILFYYPFPDYKTPSICLSEDFFYQKNQSITTLYPTQSHQLSVTSDINEPLFAQVLYNEKILHHFSNSFLIITNIEND